MIQEIAKLIENRTTWQIDVNLFIGHLPLKTKAGLEIPDRVLLLLENTPADTVPQLPDRADKPVQFWNRSKSYLIARADAFALYQLLQGQSWLDLPIITPGVKWTAMIVDAMSWPTPIEQPGESGLYVFSCNYLWRIKATDE